MKLTNKVLAVLLLIVSIVSMSACSNNTNTSNTSMNVDTTSYNTNSSYETTYLTTSQLESTETTSVVVVPPVEDGHYIFSRLDYHMTCEFETPTRWLYLNCPGTYRYVNKIDNEVYNFCFDPLCEHNTMDCPVQMFINCPGLYSKVDNRIYVLRSDCVYSVDFNASDIKLEYSFSDLGKNIHDPSDNDPNLMGMTPAIYDNFIFFLHHEIISKENNIPKYLNKFYRFDVITKEMVCLSDKQKDISFGKFCISKNGEIFFLSIIDNKYSLFYSDLDFSFIKSTNVDSLVASSTLFNTLDGIFGVMYDDYVFDETKNKNVATSNYLIFFDFETKTQTKISPNYTLDGTKGLITFLYGDSNTAYYTINDPYFVFSFEGKYKLEEIYNTKHTIYFASFKNKENKVVFEGVVDKTPGAESFMVYSITKTCNLMYLDGYIMKETPDASATNQNYQTRIRYRIELDDGNINIIETLN